MILVPIGIFLHKSIYFLHGRKLIQNIHKSTVFRMLTCQLPWTIASCRKRRFVQELERVLSIFCLLLQFKDTGFVLVSFKVGGGGGYSLKILVLEFLRSWHSASVCTYFLSKCTAVTSPFLPTDLWSIFGSSNPATEK